MPIQYQPPATATPPGGIDTQLQYNNSSVFGGIPIMTYDGTNVDTFNVRQAPLELSILDPIITPDFTGGTKISSNGYGALFLQGTDPARANIAFVPNGPIANYPSILSFFSTDFIADATNYSEMAFLSKGASDTYHAIVSLKGGSGTLHPMNIEATNSAGATAQLVIGVDGGVSVGTGTAAGSTNLKVAGTITGSNLSGTNTGDQTLVGLGGVPTSRSLTIGPTTSDLSSDRSFITSVTNDAQTKAAIVPNTAPSAGQILSGNAGGTAYAPVTLSGSGATATLSALGVLTLSAIANATLSNSSMTLGGTSVSLGGSIEFLNTTIRPTASYTVPANFSSVVAGGSLIIDAGLTLTLSSGAVMKIL